VQPLWKTVWSLLKKPKIGLLYDQVLGCVSKEKHTTVFLAAVFTIIKIRMQLRCPWRDDKSKQDVYT
jgi:hypothetical protein